MLRLHIKETIYWYDSFKKIYYDERLSEDKALGSFFNKFITSININTENKIKGTDPNPLM